MKRQGWMYLFAAVLLVAAPVAAQTHTVQAGDDGWVTQGGGLTVLDLTGWDLSSVFPGGSVVPGTEVVNLKGKPIKPSLGSIDTIIRHTGSHTFTSFGQVKPIPVQVVGLSMVSDNDTVSISGYGTYSLEVYNSTAAAGTGSMSVKQVNGDGGVFSSSFQVHPVVVFVNTSNPSIRVRLDCGAALGACGTVGLIATGIGWVHTGGPGNFNPAAEGVTPLASGIAFDADGDGVNDTVTIGRSNTFIPGFAAQPPFNPAAGTHNHADYSSRHVTKPPQDCKKATANDDTPGSGTTAAVGVDQPQPLPCPVEVDEPADPDEPAEPEEPVVREH